MTAKSPTKKHDAKAEANASAREHDEKNAKAGTPKKDEAEQKQAKERSEGKRSGKQGKARAKNTHNKDLGKRGEDAACMFLERRGYEILERNWTCPAGEADIIALDEEALHFIEVKTRSSAGSGFPAEAVTKEKRRRYEAIAEYYLRSYEGPEVAVTFDVVSILVTAPERAFLQLIHNVLGMDCH